MRKLYAISIPILIIGLLYVPFYQYETNEKLENPRSFSIKSQKREANPLSLVESESFSEESGEGGGNEKNLSFPSLISYVLERQFLDGGFQISQGTQSFMNATYFSSLGLSLVGRVNETLEDLKYFLSNTSVSLPSPNSSLWGFKNWLEGEVSLRSTSFAILTANLTHVEPSVYNESVINYVTTKLNTSLASENISLLDLSLATLALHSYKHPVYGLDSTVKIALNQFFTNGHFTDEHSTNETQKMFQNYLSTLVLHQMGALNNPQDIEQFILSRRYNGSEEDLQGGFGWDPSSPTVFQTGLALETLVLVNSTINPSIINSSLSFVNRSQVHGGGLSKNPQNRRVTIFESVGAFLVYHATKKLLETYNSRVTFSSEQLIIGEGLGVNVSVQFMNSHIRDLSVNYTLLNASTPLTGFLSFNASKSIYTTTIPTDNDTETPAPGFGSYQLLISVTFNITGLPLFQNTLTKEFRVGFRIHLKFKYPEGELGFSPGTPLRMNFTAESAPAYRNTTGTFNYKIIRVNTSETVLSRSALHPYNTTFALHWSVPTEWYLGHYKMRVFLNDSFGFNHSANNTRFRIWDDVIYDIRGNRSDYSMGEPFSFDVNLTYNASGSFPDYVPAQLEFNWLTQFDIPYEWGRQPLNARNENEINGTMPTVFPDTTDLQISIRLIWGITKTTVDLFEANLTVTGLKIGDVIINGSRSRRSLLIGGALNTTFKLKDANTNASISNASLRANFKWKNETIQTLQPYSINASYLLNQSLDPNLPQANNSVKFEVRLPWNESWVEIDQVLELDVRGVPEIKAFQKEINRRGNASFITVHIVRNGSNTSLMGLNVSCNITGEEILYAPLGIIGKGVYVVSFTPREVGTYHVKIFRALDKFELRTFTFSIKENEGRIFTLWRETVAVGILSCLIAGYAIIRWYVGRKVSKRWLIERWRKKEKGETKRGKA